MWKAFQLSVICENLVTLSKEITQLELFNTFLITVAKTPKEVGHQSYVSEIKLATRDTFLRLRWPVKRWWFISLFHYFNKHVSARLIFYLEVSKIISGLKVWHFCVVSKHLGACFSDIPLLLVWLISIFLSLNQNLSLCNVVNSDLHIDVMLNSCGIYVRGSSWK